MAGSAFLGSRSVKQDSLFLHEASQFVASLAANVKMRALQGERRPLFVIEKRRFPLGTVVTFNTLRYPVLCKLLPMDIFMTTLALGRGCLKVHVHQAGLHVWRLVAIDARDGAVRAKQRERSAGVIEPGKFSPGLGRVTGFAPCLLAAESRLLHTIFELPCMGVEVAGFAG